jgi:hypothetical protein
VQQQNTAIDFALDVIWDMWFLRLDGSDSRDVPPATSSKMQAGILFQSCSEKELLYEKGWVER